MKLKDRILNRLRNKQDQESSSKIDVESKEFKEAVEKEVERRIKEEIDSLDEAFFKEASALIKPIEPSKQEDSKSQEEKVKEILNNKGE